MEPISGFSTKRTNLFFPGTKNLLLAFFFFWNKKKKRKPLCNSQVSSPYACRTYRDRRSTCAEPPGGGLSTTVEIKLQFSIHRWCVTLPIFLSPASCSNPLFSGTRKKKKEGKNPAKKLLTCHPADDVRGEIFIQINLNENALRTTRMNLENNKKKNVVRVIEEESDNKF